MELKHEESMTDFDNLMKQIENEAEEEGPAGRAHLEELATATTWSSRSSTGWRALGLTQQQVADAAGLHQSVVSRIEQGVANPTARTLSALARALDARLTLMLIQCVEAGESGVDAGADLMPFVEEEEYLFLKTIIPSRKATRHYLRESENDDAP